MYTQHYMSSLDDAKHFRRMELNLIKHFPLQFVLYLDIALGSPHFRMLIMSLISPEKINPLLFVCWIPDYNYIFFLVFKKLSDKPLYIQRKPGISA